MFDDEKQTQTNFHTMKREVLSFCKVHRSTDGFEFINALTEMGGTYTKKLCVDCDWSCECEFSFIHESMFEITAYHFGKQFGELIFKYMSSDYVANKIKINQQHQNDTPDEKPNTSDVEKENVIDLCITWSESEYHLLAKRLWRDVGVGKMYYVFVTTFLKHLPVLQAFMELMERKEYNELHSVFLSELTKKSKEDRDDLTQICFEENVNKLIRKHYGLKDYILKLLHDGNSEMIDKFIVRSERKSVRRLVG